MDVSLDENWYVLLSLFPENWRELAKETKAMVRKFRNFSSEENLMRTLLLHLACGYSLRETTVRAKASQMADVSLNEVINRWNELSQALAECSRKRKPQIESYGFFLG